MKGLKVLFLVGSSFFLGSVYAQECGPSDRYDEGAYECAAVAEVDATFDADYAAGVAESRMWRRAFAHCSKLAERFEEDLIPVPIVGSQSVASEKVDGIRVRHSILRAFYCGGL